MDGFVSLDQSTWHVALSVEPRRRITAEPTSEAAQQMATGVLINPRAYIHIYPYGGMTVTVGLSLVFANERPADQVIELVKALIGRRNEPAFSFTMRGLETAPIHGLIRQLNDMTTKAIIPKAPSSAEPVPSGVWHHALDYAISVGADQDQLSDAELSGLITLDPDFALLKREWIEARASLYGKYGGDRVAATRASLAVVTSPRHFSESGRRRFFWRCHALKEFAALQADTIYAITERLRMTGRPSGPGEELTRRLLAVAEHLIELPRALPAHHRKWFYECQELLQGTQTIDRYLEVLADLHDDARNAAMMRRVSESQPITFDLTNSQIGTINLGSIIGNVQNHLTALNDPAAAEVRDGLARLTQAAIDAEDLEDGAREELLEHIDLLAEEAQKHPAERRLAITRSVLGIVATTVPAVTTLSEVWTGVAPTLEAFFS